MDIKEYISSGILEAYVIGDLSDSERLEVEKNIAQHTELRHELAAIEETNENIFQQLAIAPHARIREKLFSQLKKSLEVKTVPLASRSSDFWRYATAASIAFAFLSSYLAFNYWNKWRQSETTLANLITQNQQIAKDYNVVNQRLEQIESDFKVTGNPDFIRVVMKGNTNAPQALAAVYWNSSSKEVYLNIQNLKILSREKQYQLWAIIDGTPVDCGIFDAQLSGLLKMKNANKNPTTFAVTIEPRGGKASPSLETMQVAGNVTG